MRKLVLYCIGVSLLFLVPVHGREPLTPQSGASPAQAGIHWDEVVYRSFTEAEYQHTIAILGRMQVLRVEPKEEGQRGRFWPLTEVLPPELVSDPYEIELHGELIRYGEKVNWLDYMYGFLTPVAMEQQKAIEELQAQIDVLREEIEALKQ